MQRVRVMTLGCRLNQYESDALERQLALHGYAVVADDMADLYILNSCTITHQADREARTLIRQLHQQRSTAKIVVTGCYASAAAAEISALPGVAMVVGNAEKSSLVQHLQSLSDDPKIFDAPHSIQADLRVPPALAPRRSRVYLKIQDGCDYRCAFCIVPQVRGKSRSIPPQVLIQRLEEIVAAGAPEIVLTGVHLGTYGRDLRPRLDLTDLLLQLLPRLCAARLRLSSIDPHEVTDDLIGLLRDFPNQLCRYLHLPVQSADDGVLRHMRRAHTVADLTDLLPRLVQQIPGIGIGSDVIVGFPQEGAAEFERSHDVLRTLPMSYLHVFSYSQRSNTAAAAMPGQVQPGEIARRSRIMRGLSAELRCRFNSSLIGSLQTVVVHRARHPRTQDLTGITDNFAKVHFQGPDSLLGRVAKLAITQAAGKDLRGVWTAP